MHRASVRTATLGLLALTACTASVRRFPLAAPLWHDDDQQRLAAAPAEYWSPLLWDAVDHSAFRPLTRALAIEVGHEAVNVNALDEVPDSSWYNNRLALRAYSPDEIALGPCRDHPAPPDGGTWTVVSGKPNGWSPGVVARGPDGHRYLLKADGVAQSEQPTGADVIGSRIYWAAGYNVPCNRVVILPRTALVLDPHATYEDENGRHHPMSARQLANLFDRSSQQPDGRFRFGASMYLDGRPLGPFKMEGLRGDDPNDAIAHEDRRDVRASRLLSAWLAHFDAREQNTLDTWQTLPGGGGYVRHNFIDFADCLGGVWPIDGMSRRMGHSYYFDLEHIAEDWITLGLINRPWDHEVVDRDGWIFGYYGASQFDPAAWRAGYPNPAFDRMTERDGAWMARIIARFSDATIHTVVAEARYRSPQWNEYLEHAMIARRDRVLARYLTRLSPLADVTVDPSGLLCMRDRAVESGVYHHARYGAALRRGERLESRTLVAAQVLDDGRVCVRLPVARVDEPGLRDDAPERYRVVDVVTVPDGRHAIAPLRVHLYDLGPRGYTVAGLER